MKRDVITFKGTREGLSVYCDEQASWEEIEKALHERLQGKEGEFFKGAGVILDAGKRKLSPEQVSSLWQIFQEKRLTIKGIKTGAATSFGKIPPAEQRSPAEAAGMETVSWLPTLTVTKNIRSGQDITFAGNVIVFGDVKPGSQITAAGFVLVLGTLNGTVHAGAEGDEKAWVGALRLQPNQLRIASRITRAPEEEPQEPEVAKIENGIIIVREMKGSVNYLEYNRGN